MNNDINLDALLTLAAVKPPTLPTPTAQPPVTAQRIEGVTPGSYALIVTDTVYHTQCPGASSTALKKMLRSPAHYRAYVNAPDEDTAARRFGRAVHALLLEGATFLDHFTVWKGGRRQGGDWTTFVQSNPAKTILSEAEHLRALEAAMSLRYSRDFPIGTWLEGVPATPDTPAIPASLAEFSIFWEEKLGDGDDAPTILCKARIDAHNRWPAPVALDVKTTDDARPRPFLRHFRKMDYDLQAAHYSAGLRAFYGEEFPFVFAVVEDQEPFATAMYQPTKRMLANGEAKRMDALHKLKHCQDTNDWPSYEQRGIQELGLPFLGRYDPEE